ncbi:glycosyltransferase family 39 protein [Serratia nevei]|uniref:glycosyltransferase family 39 protein n=1 Tax=Serratia nevei TaxID=2703794 RepID=UPI003FA705CF
MLLQNISNTPLSSNRLKSIGYKHYVLLILIFATVIRFISLTDNYFWADEASSVLISRYDMATLLHHASFDVHPPLYYLLLHGWMALFGDSIFAVRSLSLVFGVATVGLAITLSRRVVNERVALLTGWLMAIMPMAVHHSQQARMYSLMGMLMISATMALVLWLKTPSSRRYLTIYALLMTLAFYTHYFTIFTLIAHWTVLLAFFCRCKDASCYLKRPAWWLANLAIGLAYMPWLLILLNLLAHIEELKVGGDVGWIPQVQWSDLPAMYWRFFTGNDGRHYPWGIFYLVPLIFVGVCGLLCMKSENERELNFLLIFTLFIPVTLVFLISWKTPLFVDRYLFFSALCVPVLLAILIEKRKNKIIGFSLLLFATLFFGNGLRHNYSSQKDEFKEMVHYINSNYQANDAVVVNNMFNYLSYIYYNRKGYRALLYTPVSKPNAYGFGSLFYDSAAQTYVENLHVLAVNHRRVWLVSGGDFEKEFAPPPSNWVNIGAFKNRAFESRLFVVQDD